MRRRVQENRPRQVNTPHNGGQLQGPMKKQLTNAHLNRQNSKTPSHVTGILTSPPLPSNSSQGFVYKVLRRQSTFSDKLLARTLKRKLDLRLPYSDNSFSSDIPRKLKYQGHMYHQPLSPPPLSSQIFLQSAHAYCPPIPNSYPPKSTCPLPHGELSPSHLPPSNFVCSPTALYALRNREPKPNSKQVQFFPLNKPCELPSFHHICRHHSLKEVTPVVNSLSASWNNDEKLKRPN